MFSILKSQKKKKIPFFTENSYDLNRSIKLDSILFTAEILNNFE